MPPGLRSAAALIGSLVAVSCAAAPREPNILVLPGDGKIPALFEQDDVACRGQAGQQIGSGPPAGQAPGGGGASGAAAAGTSQAQPPAAEMQRRYDAGYARCMAERGNTVPTTPGGAPYLFVPHGYSGAPAYYGGYGGGPYLGGSAVALGVFGGGWRHWAGGHHRGGGWRGGHHGGGRHGGGGSRGGRR
jgi:hypothetical protein